MSDDVKEFSQFEICNLSLFGRYGFSTSSDLINDYHCKYSEEEKLYNNIEIN